jgi:dihydroorotase
LAPRGLIHEGRVSTRLGLAGIPSQVEEIAVHRDIAIARLTGKPVHLCHLSTEPSLALVRAAKLEGISVTCETAPHYIHLTDEDLAGYNTNRKMNPPLRGESDRRAVIDGLADGTIGVIATDHAPHAEAEKARGLEAAPFGITGLETGFAVSYTVLVRGGIMTLAGLIRLMSASPAAFAGLPRGRIAVGDAADVAVIDIGSPYEIDRSAFVSKGKNTPFQGMRVYGRTRCTILGGRIVWEDRL